MEGEVTLIRPVALVAIKEIPFGGLKCSVGVAVGGVGVAWQ